MPVGIYDRTKSKPNSSLFQEGNRPICPFKKGNIPWNKGKKGLQIGYWKGKHHTENSKKKMSDSQKGHTPWNKNKKRPEISGKKHYNWKGGRRIDKDGYVLIYSPNHPFCTSQRYVFEHRLVMEKHLGRYLLPEEVVHHKNDIPDDNRIEKLKLFANNGEHLKFHGLC